jgi:hypothetical protein
VTAVCTQYLRDVTATCTSVQTYLPSFPSSPKPLPLEPAARSPGSAAVEVQWWGRVCSVRPEINFTQGRFHQERPFCRCWRSR